MINAHENVIKTIREEELDLEDIFTSIRTLAHELRTNPSKAMNDEQGIEERDIDLQYILAYAIEGRKIVAGKE